MQMHIHMHIYKMFERLDTSKDGKITTQEFRKYHGLHGADIRKAHELKEPNYLWWWIVYDAVCCLIVVGLVG